MCAVKLPRLFLRLELQSNYYTAYAVVASMREGAPEPVPARYSAKPYLSRTILRTAEKLPVVMR